MQSSLKKTGKKFPAKILLLRARRSPLIAFLILTFASHAFAQTTEPVDTISIDTGLVDLNVAVFSRNPKIPVGELQQKDFAIFEDGEPEEISFFASAAAPFDLLLLIDLSGSTADKMDLIRKSSRRFVEAARPTDRIGIVTFADAPHIVSTLTSDREALFERIKKMEKPRGGTNFWDSLHFVLTGMLNKAARRSAVIVMTDGIDNALPDINGPGSRVTIAELLDTVREADAIVIPIYLDTEREMVKQRKATAEAFALARMHLQQLASESGSLVYQARKVEDLKGVYEQVIRDLGTVYSIGYRPKKTERNGSWRSVRVQLVGRPDLAARTKRGYFAK